MEVRVVIGAAKGRRNLFDEVAANRRLRALLADLDLASPPDDGLVFVVCSLDPAFDPVYDAVACAAASVGLRAVRVKDVR